MGHIIAFLAIFIVPGIVIGMVILFAMTRSRKINQAWESAAKTLGLQYSPSAILKSRNISGDLHGFHVLIDIYTSGSGDHSQSYTRLRVTYPTPLNLGLRLTREGMLTSVAKFFGSQDIQVGDSAFDDSLHIKGNDESSIREFLNPSRRLRIQRFLRNHSDATIQDDSIHWRHRGTISNSGLLVNKTRAMLRLAWHLTGDRESDQSLNEAMQLQNDGLPEEALRLIEAVVVKPETSQETPPIIAEPVEEKIMWAELKYMEGETAIAHQQFEELKDLDPDDPEIGEWTDLTREEAESPPAKQPKPATDFSIKGFCDELFGENTSSFEINRTFEASYAGHEVSWAGELQKIERNYSSFLFENSTGYKATFKIDERPSSFYGSRTVLAIVHFSEDLAESLKPRQGESIEFRGKLIKADGLMRNVYLDHGQLS